MTQTEPKARFWIPSFEVLKTFITDQPTAKKPKTIRIKSKKPLTNNKYVVGDTLYIKESYSIGSVIDNTFILYRVDNKVLPVYFDESDGKHKVLTNKAAVKAPKELDNHFNVNASITMSKDLCRFKFKILKSRHIKNDHFHGYELEISK